jgi:hypothetical protein
MTVMGVSGFHASRDAIRSRDQTSGPRSFARRIIDTHFEQLNPRCSTEMASYDMACNILRGPEFRV